MFSWGEEESSTGLLIIQISNLYSPGDLTDPAEVTSLSEEL